MVDPTLVAEGKSVRELLKNGLGDVLEGGREGGSKGGRGETLVREITLPLVSFH